VTPEELKRMDELCAQIAVEKDQDKFDYLVRSLNDLLEDKKHRLQHLPHPPPNES
jgi:hypothetical protein